MFVGCLAKQGSNGCTELILWLDLAELQLNGNQCLLSFCGRLCCLTLWLVVLPGGAVLRSCTQCAGKDILPSGVRASLYDRSAQYLNCLCKRHFFVIGWGKNLNAFLALKINALNKFFYLDIDVQQLLSSSRAKKMIALDG